VCRDRSELLLAPQKRGSRKRYEMTQVRRSSAGPPECEQARQRGRRRGLRAGGTHIARMKSGQGTGAAATARREIPHHLAACTDRRLNSLPSNVIRPSPVLHRSPTSLERVPTIPGNGLHASDLKWRLDLCIIANSLTERCGHKTFQISGFWADHGLHGHYEFRALLSTGSGALTMHVRFR
jgi:hypothetical protein